MCLEECCSCYSAVHAILREAPFFDGASKNGLLWKQAETDMRLWEVCTNRQAFENRLECSNAVKRWLDDHDRWLLIIDNVADSALLGTYLPSGTGGSVLITTRDAVIAQQFSSPGCAFEMKSLPLEEAKQLVCQILNLLNLLKTSLYVLELRLRYGRKFAKLSSSDYVSRIDSRYRHKGN